MLTIRVVTPDGTIYEGEGLEITLPTKSGQVSVLPRHIPLISILKAGEISIKKSDHEVHLAISGGALHVRSGSIVDVIADTAERAEHIDVERAEAARKRAEELLKEAQTLDDQAFAALRAKMEKELARIRVGKKYKRLPKT